MRTDDFIASSSREDNLRSLYSDVFQKFSRSEIKPHIHLTFYPFAGLNHTIRIRQQRVYVRISDIFQEAPFSVHKALAHILIGKLFKRRPQSEHESTYRRYTYQPQVLRASDLAKQARGRKKLRSARGQNFDLDQLFFRLNQQYFGNQLSKPKLSWSNRPTRRILGHHDAIHNVIVISRSLDSGVVPEYVVEYVMYHEMLHIKYPTRIINERRILHSSAFRAEEKKFYDYEKAIKWLEKSLPVR